MLGLSARRSKSSRSFLGNASGATALEFALVAAPFFFMILCILELGLVYMVSTSLDNATVEAARQIRTGENNNLTYTSASNPTPHAMTSDDFANIVCANVGWIPTQICHDNLSIDVRTFTSFSNPATPDPAGGGTFDATKLTFATGAAHSIVVVRSFYKWQLITPVLSSSLARLPNNVALITSTTAFRNEPYT